MAEELVRVVVLLPTDLWQRIQSEAVQDDLTVNEEFVDCLRAAIAEMDREPRSYHE